MTLDTFVQTLRRQWIALAATAVVGLIVFALVLPHFRKYTATSTLLAASAPSTSSGVLDPQRDPISSAVNLNDLQVLATSDSILHSVAAKLHLTQKQADRLSSEVKAKAIFNSDILPIAVTDSDEKVAISATNELTHELSKYAEHIATGRYVELIANLERQIAERRADLKIVDGKIAAVSSGDFYVTAENGTNAIDSRLVALQQQEEQLQSTVGGDEAAASVTALQPAISHDLARHEILAQDPSILAQRSQLGKDVASLNLALSGYTLTYPGLKGMILQVKSEAAEVAKAENRTASNPAESESYVNALIASNKAHAALAADRAQLAAVRSQIDGVQTHFNGSTGEGSAVAELRRSRAAGEDVYTDLSQRLARARADRAEAASVGSVVVIDLATTATPALLGRPLVLGAAILAIFGWLGITLAFILDGADDRLRTAESIEKLYGKPVFTPVG